MSIATRDELIATVIEAPLTQSRIIYVLDPFACRIFPLFTQLRMNGKNPIRSTPTIRYRTAPPQQVVRNVILYNPYWFASCVKIVIRKKTLPKSVNGAISAMQQMTVLSRNNASRLDSRPHVHTHTHERFLPEL